MNKELKKAIYTRSRLRNKYLKSPTKRMKRTIKNNEISVRATMIERSNKNNEMKCNLFVQVVILNIELLNLFFTYVIFKLPINYIINYTY